MYTPVLIVNGQRLWEFALTVAVLIAVPGPSVLFVITRGVILCRRAALATVIGNAGGLSVQVLLVVVGLGSLLARYQALTSIVRLLGAMYLIFLGVQMLRHRRALALLAEPATAPRAGKTIVWEGFIVGVTNPKALVIFTAVFAAFIDAGEGNVRQQLAELGTMCIAIGLLSDSVWAILSGSVRAWFRRSPRSLEYIGAGGGLVLIGLGIRLWAARSPD